MLILISCVMQGTVGKPLISPVPSAAHVRNMRKGSTEHLVLNIDSEANNLINHEETDEDKGLWLLVCHIKYGNSESSSCY